MTTLRARLRHLFAAVIAVVLVGLGATDAQATHFRYGTLRWEKTGEDPNNVTIKVTTESAWRCTFYVSSCSVLPNPVNTGQQLVIQRVFNNAQLFTAPLNLTPSAINNMEDWFVGSSVHQNITFAKTNLQNGGVRIFWAGNARLSSLLDNNNDDPFRVEALMSETANAASPAASILPIITVGYPSSAAKFFIPAGDVEGDTLTWRISELGRSSLTKARPDGFDDIPALGEFSIDANSGEVTWNTSLEWAPGTRPFPFDDLYAVQFIVTDSKGAETPVDALLRLIQTIPNPPVADINGSQNQYTVDVRPGNLVSFVLTGTDNDAGATVTLTSGALPPGASMTPSLPTGGSSPRSSTFNWTPTLAQAGNNYTISFAVTDEFANQDTISAVIRVLVNFPPEVTCPLPATAEATGPAGADNVTVDATVEDSDPDTLTVRWFVDGVLVETDTATGPGSTVVSRTQSYTFVPGPLHAIRVEVTDGQATRECTTSVTVVDTTPPVVTVPDTVWEATGPAGAVATFTGTAVDIVDGAVTPVTCPTSGNTFPLGTTTVTCTATDSRGNIGSGTGTVTVQDTTGPAVTVPPTVWEATGPTGAIATFTGTAIDLVEGPITPVICPMSGTMFPIGTTTVTCTATDSQGNIGTGTGTVTVQDTAGPVVTVPPTVWEATGPTGAIATFTGTAIDLVEGPITPVICPMSGTMFPLGVTTVTCTATDSLGNVGTGTGTVTVQDTTGPVVTVPPTVWEATSPAGAVATFTGTAVDLVDGAVTPVTCPTSGNTFPLGTTNVTCSATDSRGNTGSGSGTVTVQDTTPPVITNNPGKLVREATGPGGAAVTWPALVATDAADPNVPVTCTPASGSTFAINPPGPVTAVVCTAMDDSGNPAIPATFDVRIVDTTPPVFSNVPGPISVPQTQPAGAIVTYTPPTATDLVDLNRPVVCLPASGTLFPVGVTTVTCNASDTRGNAATPVTFTVTVVAGDTKPPKVCMKLSPGTLWPPDHKMKSVKVILVVQDNDDPTPTCAITGVTSSEPVSGPKWGNTTPDWTFSGLTLFLRSERYSRHGRTYTVTVACSDDSGNTTITRGTVRVPHSKGHSGGGGHHLTGGEDNNNGPSQSGSCCIRPTPGPGHDDDDDDDDNFSWTNDLGGFAQKGPHPDTRCFDDDDDDGDDDDGGVMFN